jgi:acetoin utilization deacetylase AcuC-like enzyme
VQGNLSKILQTAYLTHPILTQHAMGFSHPECPERLAAIQDRLIAAGIWDYLLHEPAEKVSLSRLQSIHTPAYIAKLINSVPQAGLTYLDPDTAMNPYTLEAALYAAGAAQKAVDMVMQQRVQNAMCAVRPPGHHAGADYAMGFCFFNNAAIAARHACDQYGLDRVVIVDFDVHHGNGTEDIFCEDPRILMVGCFQHPFFPYSGDIPKGNNMLNVPLPKLSKHTLFRALVNEVWLPAIKDFQPQFIVISAGFDAHKEEEMGGLMFVEADYAWVTHHIMQMAARYAKGRIVSILEGGYNLSALGRSVTEHLRVLAGLSS